MNTEISCVPCYLRGVFSVLDTFSLADERKKEIAHEILCRLPELSFTASPPENAMLLYRDLYEKMAIDDPYAELKLKMTEFAQELLDQVLDEFEKFPDRLEGAVRMAIAGNILDIALDISPETARARLLSALTEPLDTKNLENFRNDIKKAERILYIMDNCGEAVFDRYLLEYCGEKVTIAVRGKPILNDITRKEVEASGLSSYRIVDTGSMIPGVVLHDCSEEFRNVYESSDLIISKGQGNYETLSGEKGAKTYFLLRAKCTEVMRSLGNVPAMSMVLAYLGAR